MRRFVLGLFASIGIVAVLMVIGLGVVIWQLAGSKPSVPDKLVLNVDLDRGLIEGPSQDAWSTALFGSKQTMRDFLDALDRAGDDTRVKGIYARLGGDGLGLAAVQEVRDAIAAFRAKGKFTVAFTESFGEFGPGTRAYYLATAFDEVWLQPLGSVGLIGLHAQTPFLRGTLDRLGIVASFARREEYKSAMNTFTETGMTPQQREEMEALLTSASGQIVRGIAAARNLPEPRVGELIDRGPFIADEAKEAGLVDRIGYRDEAIAAARAKAGSGAEFQSIARYLEGAGRPHDSGPVIALIYGTGMITEGGGTSRLLGNEELSAREVGRAFRQAFADKEVRAILFRINSPGGSAVASETIWREVARARQRGKPVIVSMANAAGSGGYYIAAPADKIVAQPATLTGSIGVLAGKFVFAELLQKLGVTAEPVQRGANAAMFSQFEDFSPVGRQRLDTFLDKIYAGFKQHVAAGRRMTDEQVEAVAKGRVWSGEEARERGLVDALGGYDVALRLAREAVGIPADGAFELVVFPERRSMIERIVERLVGKDGEPDAPSSVQVLAARLAALGAALDTALGGTGALRMPAIGEIR